MSDIYKVTGKPAWESSYDMNSVSGHGVRDIPSSDVFLGVPVKSHLYGKFLRTDEFGNTVD